MSQNILTWRVMGLAFIAGAFFTTAAAQQNSIEELFIEAECQVAEGMHASFDFRKNEMFSGAINGGYVGATYLKVGFIHTTNEQGGYDTQVTFGWTKSPIDGELSLIHI